MSDDELHDLAAAYALDALDDDERCRFEAHLPNCEKCSREIDEFQRSVAVLGELDMITPPSELKDQVMARLGSTEQVSPAVSIKVVEQADRRRRPPWRVLTMAAATVAIIVGAALWSSGSTKPDDAVAAVLTAPDAIRTDLEGEGGVVRVVWSPGRDQAVVLGSGLDDPGSGRAYALWFLLDNGPRLAGLFVPTSSGDVEHLVEVDDLDGIGWGVSIEPEGGSEGPTSEIIFSGTL